MNRLRQLCGATCLVLTFTLSVWAGQMGTPYTSPTLPPTTTTSTSEPATTDSVLEESAATGGADTIDEQIIDATLGAVLTMLSLL